jgi:hypothetical protein
LGLSENRVYSQTNSHLIGIMISKTIGFRGTLFSDTPYCSWYCWCWCYCGYCRYCHYYHLICCVWPWAMQVRPLQGTSDCAGCNACGDASSLTRLPCFSFDPASSLKTRCGLWIPALRPRKPELGHLGASQRCYGMLWDAMGWVGRVQLQVTSGPMAQMQRR